MNRGAWQSDGDLTRTLLAVATYLYQSNISSVQLPYIKSLLRWIKEWGTANLEGVVYFSRDFTFRINILNSISTPHKHSFFYYY